VKILYVNLKTRIVLNLFCFIASIVSASSLHAYEIPTHREMSLMAYNRSVLVLDVSLLEDLDVDMTGVFRNSFNDEGNILQLVMDGAEFEDADLFPLDSGLELFRMKHHFYNPQNGGSALKFGIFGSNSLIKTHSSANWALEDQGGISVQYFSFKDANDYFYKALTTEFKTFQDLFWGRTFQTLGHVIHHVQDMAQPQHTRNDSHTPLPGDYQKTYYEYYTEKKRTNPGIGLPYSGYPDIDLRVLNTARKFWDGSGTHNGKGLSEFSSNNFVSSGTNFGGGAVVQNYVIGAQYPAGLISPGTNNLLITSINVRDMNLVGPPQPLTGNLHDIGTLVIDRLYSAYSGFNPKTSSFSIFDSDLDSIDSEMNFMLTRFNYDAAHEFLIPRAVAYSAGLINYFFRGRIEATVTTDGDSIEITNTSNGGIADALSPTTFQAGGAFEVFYETNSGERKPLLSLENLTLGSNLPVNGTHTINGLSSALQGVTESCNKKKIIVLFDGEIGTERGLATTNIKATPRRSLAEYTNTYTWGGWDPTDWINPSSRNISNTEGTDLADCGSKYYMFSRSSNDSPYLVYQFDLSPVNTIKPLAYNGKVFDPGLSSNGYMRMSNDGIHMLLETDYVLYKYTLATPFDVTTANFSTQTFAPGYRVSGFDTNVDGTKMYIATTSGDYIIEYSMNPAWDITSLTPTGSAISVIIEMGARNISDVKMSTSGTMMLTIGESESLNRDKVYKYDLTTAFDLSTASYSEVLTTVVFGDESRSIAGEALEDLFIIWEFGDNFIYQYDAR